MKAQTHPTIKAHLVRDGVYLLLIVAVCPIPFALAQRKAAERAIATQRNNQNLAVGSASAGFKSPQSATRGAAKASAPTLDRTWLLPLQSGSSLSGHLIAAPPPPEYPLVILYDQYNNNGTFVTVSATFTDSPSHNSDLADDFVVPSGQTWNVQSIDAEGSYSTTGPANSFNVFIYTDSAGFPGTQVHGTLNQTWTQNGNTFTVNLSPAAVLTAGTYWIEIQANMTVNPNGEWGWVDRTLTSNNAAAWRNPGGGFGLCPSWSRRAATCGIDAPEPDQVWRINGTIGEGRAEGCYPGFTTAEGCNALFQLTTGAGNTAAGWDSLYADTTGSYNTALGGGTLVLYNADSNTSTGAAALLLNGDGMENCAYGTDALVYNGYFVNGAHFNDGFGAFALFSNTDGYTNNAFGNHALFQNIHGAGNTAVGDKALQNNDLSGTGNGNNNTAVGAQALLANVDGFSNNAIGYLALESITDGVQNNAVGVYSLQNNNGAANVALGDSAFVNSATGSFNTVVGWHAGAGAAVDGDHNIYLGATSGPANGSENSTIRIGDPGFITSCYIAGITNSIIKGVPVVVAGNSQLGVAASSARFKDDIKPLDKASESIFALNPVTFRYKKAIDSNATPQFGLVAEQVAKVNPDLVVRDRDGKPYTVRYEAVNALLLNEFIKEHRTLEKQQATIALQESQIKALTTSVREQGAKIREVSAQLELSEPEPQTAVNNH